MCVSSNLIPLCEMGGDGGNGDGVSVLIAELDFLRVTPVAIDYIEKFIDRIAIGADGIAVDISMIRLESDASCGGDSNL